MVNVDQSPGRRRGQSASDRLSPRFQLDTPTASWKIDATYVHGGVVKPLCRELHQGKESEDAIQKKDDATVPDHTGIPMEEIPYVGLRFDSLQRAQEFYSNYAKKVGFVMRIRNTNFDKTRKELKVPINQSIHCSREGYRESRVKAAMRVKRITTAGCKARMYVMLDRHNDNWLVTKLELKHTHVCFAEQAVHYSEYKELTMHAKCVIQNNDEADIQPNKTYLALANEVGMLGRFGLYFTRIQPPLSSDDW
ncbi:hypothetical protein Ahy_A09g044144 [Arachis hypogaea]|uniref:FAR1 domain-containing protein n=1 Tax=Arachis hypogaea TaxID=3818 RepID=A0A445BJM2_ARAHY|nr:hypothetical protein Ahy_A09g044144 [Arachis hypogaea]